MNRRGSRPAGVLGLDTVNGARFPAPMNPMRRTFVAAAAQPFSAAAESGVGRSVAGGFSANHVVRIDLMPGSMKPGSTWKDRAGLAV